MKNIDFEMFVLTLGYFCYDFCDVISNRKGSDLFEIVLHHIVVSIDSFPSNSCSSFVI